MYVCVCTTCIDTWMHAYSNIPCEVSVKAVLNAPFFFLFSIQSRGPGYRFDWILKGKKAGMHINSKTNKKPSLQASTNSVSNTLIIPAPNPKNEMEEMVWLLPSVSDEEMAWSCPHTVCIHSFCCLLHALESLLLPQELTSWSYAAISTCRELS